MRVLSIMCHPDDMEMDCCGTLLKYKQAGHEVFSCHVANGNMGHMVIQPDELREIRIKEAQKAGALAGIEVLTMDIDDLTANAADENQRQEMVRIIRQVKPDVIITHDPEDYCSDHVEVSKLVFFASFSASCPHYHPELGTAAELTPVYYANTSGCANFIATEYVDITDVLDKKVEMMRCHESQIVWLMDHDGSDSIDEIIKRAEFWGRQCGVKYAEAFRPMIVSGRMKPYRVLP